MASSLYDGIISPQGGLYQPGPGVVMPSAASGLTTRPVRTVEIDEYTGNPILNQVKANAVAQALIGAGQSRSGAAAPSGVARALGGPQYATPGRGGGVLGQSGLPSMAFADKTYSDRLPNEAVTAIAANTFSPGFNGDPPRQQAGIEAVPMPRPRPNNGMFQQPDWTVANQGMGGIAGDVRQGNNAQGVALNKTQQALANVRANVRTTSLNPAQVAALQNPAAQAAINAGRSSYTNPNTNSVMPTKSIGGGRRNTYGDI